MHISQSTRVGYTLSQYHTGGGFLGHQASKGKKPAVKKKHLIFSVISQKTDKLIIYFYLM